MARPKKVKTPELEQETVVLDQEMKVTTATTEIEVDVGGNAADDRLNFGNPQPMNEGFGNPQPMQQEQVVDENTGVYLGKTKIGGKNIVSARLMGNGLVEVVDSERSTYKIPEREYRLY